MGFAADRLTLIRARRGWTRARLAERSGVAERAIRQYEAGEAQPRDGSLTKLAAALEVPAEFFYGPPIEDLGESAATFRAATKLPAYRRRAALAAGSLAMHFAEWMAERFDLPAVDVPDLDGLEPELAAEAVRSAWGLGNDPAPNMVHLLEAKGVFVFGLAEDCRELDAFSFWRHGRPFVLLNTMKSAEHARFDSGHELGHLVLHRHVRRTTKEHEDEAQRFSAAFLLPPRAMLATGLSHPRLADIIALKRAWQVAATTLVRRLHDVGLLSPYHYRTLMIELSKRGYRSTEPDGLPRETSRLLATVIRTMRSEGVAVPDIARQLTINERDLTEMILGLATVAVATSR